MSTSQISHDRLTCNGACGTPHDPPDEREARILALGRVLDDIYKERERQDAKWGEQNHPLDTWITVLVEEVGEAAQAVLKGRNVECRKELVQVAAVAVAAIQFIDRGRPALPHLNADEKAAYEAAAAGRALVQHKGGQE